MSVHSQIGQRHAAGIPNHQLIRGIGVETAKFSRPLQAAIRAANQAVAARLDNCDRFVATDIDDGEPIGAEVPEAQVENRLR